MSSLRERVEGLVADWRDIVELNCDHDDTCCHGICADELAAALAAEGPAPAERRLTAEHVRDAIAAWNYPARPAGPISRSQFIADHLNASLAAAPSLHGTFIIADLPEDAPSLHKEGLSAEEGDEWWKVEALDVIRSARVDGDPPTWERWRSSIISGLLRAYNYGQDCAALHKEGAGGAPERCPTCTSSVRTIKAGIAYGVLEPGECTDEWHTPVPTEIDLVRAVLCAHQTAFAKAHNGEGRGMMEAENIAIGYASVELAKLLAKRASPAGRARGQENEN